MITDGESLEVVWAEPETGWRPGDRATLHLEPRGIRLEREPEPEPEPERHLQSVKGT